MSWGRAAEVRGKTARVPAPPSVPTFEPTASTPRSSWGVAVAAVVCAAVAALARFWVHRDFYSGNPTLVARGWTTSVTSRPRLASHAESPSTASLRTSIRGS